MTSVQGICVGESPAVSDRRQLFSINCVSGAGDVGSVLGGGTSVVLWDELWN